KNQLPDVEVHYLTKPAFRTVLQANPYIHKLHLLEKNLGETLAALRAERFDHVIDLHHNLRTLRIKTALGVPSTSFNKLNFQKWLMVNFKKNILPPVHIVDRYLETAAFLGIRNDNRGLDYFLQQDYLLADLLPESHHRYAGLVIGAQHATKRLPQYKLIEVCRKISQPVVLLGGKDDYERGEEIARESGGHVFNGCGRYTLDQSAFLVKMAEQIITHDTGLMHIAAAFRKPITSVWGNTIPGFGMYPYQVPGNKIVEVEHLGCRPCSKIGYKKCPLGHFRCMNDIDVNQIGF
ncbi:MAG TPA: glycosyltransferase family 9 protein, partial [Sphingobacteriaceae bacterium]